MSRPVAGGIDQPPASKPRPIGTLLYVPLLYGAGCLLSRPLAQLAPSWRPDQVDLAGAGIALLLLLLSLPLRLQRAWGARHPWRRLGLTGGDPAAGGQGPVLGLLQGVLLAAALLAPVVGVLLLGGQAQWRGTISPALLANGLALLLGVGFAEELLFRGWLWGELELQMPRQRAQGLQALLFALVHPWYRLPPFPGLALLGGLTLLGLALARLRRRQNGNLWGPIGLHGGLVGGWFVLQKGLLEIGPWAPSWLVGPGEGDVNPIGGLLGLTTLIALHLLLREETVDERNLVHLVMMQRNESTLLDSWIRYHATLFGYKSLTIVDHGSSCKLTIQHLKAAERLGAEVIWARQTDLDFNSKGRIIEEEIKSRKKFRVAFPMDCDEFICLDQDSKLSCNPNRIRRYLKSLPRGHIFTAKRRLNNAPWSHNVFLTMPEDRPGKVFMSTKKFSSLDVGNHSCQSLLETVESAISYIHLHNKPYSWLRSSAEAKLVAHGVDTSSIQSLQEYSGPGWHLCKYLLESEEDWLRDLRKHKQLTSDAFSKRLNRIGIGHPFAKCI